MTTEKTKDAADHTGVLLGVESKLDRLVDNAQAAMDVGLENRKLLEQLLERETRVGLGAIHSLDDGRVQLSHPLVYGYEVIDEEVVVSIHEIGIYGVGSTVRQAVRETQEEVWSLFQDLKEVPLSEIGGDLQRAMRILNTRIQTVAMDA